MLGSRAREDSADFDTFACLRCGTTVTFASQPKGSEDAEFDC